MWSLIFVLFDPCAFFTLNRKSSVSAASGGETARTAKVAAQTTAAKNQNTQNKSKALISKAKQTGKAVKSGRLRPKAAEKAAVLNQKPPTESSNQDKEPGPGQFEQKAEICKKESDTPPDPSQSVVGAGPASKVKEKAAETIVSSISATSDDQPQTRDKSKRTDKDPAVKKEPTEVDESREKKTEKRPSPPLDDLMAAGVKDGKASKDASEPVQLAESGNEAVQPDGVESCADVNRGNMTTALAVPEKTNKYMESRPTASPAETKKGIINTQGIQMMKVEMFCYKYYNLTCVYSIKIEKKIEYLTFFSITSISHLFNCRCPFDCWGSDWKTPGYKKNR